MVRFVDASVDRATDVLQERTEQVGADLADRESGVEKDLDFLHGQTPDLQLKDDDRRWKWAYSRLPSDRPPCQYFCIAASLVGSGCAGRGGSRALRPGRGRRRPPRGPGRPHPTAVGDGDGSA